MRARGGMYAALRYARAFARWCAGASVYDALYKTQQRGCEYACTRARVLASVAACVCVRGYACGTLRAYVCAGKRLYASARACAYVSVCMRAHADTVRTIRATVCALAWTVIGTARESA